MAYHLNPISLQVAERYSALVLTNVICEYPNQLGHVMTGPGDVRGPRELHPIFYGCFDWHSCVHGYWLLARMLRTVADLSTTDAIREQFDSAFTHHNISAELRYLERPASQAFERPYGWAWLLMLCHELSLHDNEKACHWHERLMPLADLIADRFLQYLPKADYPVRSGTHANSAFATVLALEYAHSHSNKALSSLLKSKAREWFLGDAACQAWEPSQSDFLSPSLIEALCMLRTLPLDEFLIWFDRFLPELVDRKPATLFTPARVSDRTDGHIAHLDGLNLSRAWCFAAIAVELLEKNHLADLLQVAADAHLQASLPHVFGDYAGEHWLATFAVLAVSHEFGP